MATTATQDLFKGLLMAVMAFQQEYDTKQKEEEAEREEMTEAELEDADDPEYPEEMEAEDFVERFTDWLTSEGLESHMAAKLTRDDAKRLDHILGRAG